jgi:replicative DNA helicase
LVKEEEIENEIEQADIFKERLQHSIVSIEMALEKIVNETLAHGSTVSGTSPSSSNVSQNSSYSATVKLPKLSLKKFSGDVTKWTTFWECYESAIHNNANLTKD